MPFRFILITLSLLGFYGCHGDHDHGNHETTDEIAEGCKHLEFGPDMDLDLSGEEGVASAVHTRYLLSLAEGDDGASGGFTWTSAGGHHYFLFNQGTQITVSQGGAIIEVATQHTAPVASCDDAANVYEYMLPAGDYEIAVSSAQTMIQMVIHFAGSMHGHAGGGEHHGGGEGGQ